MHFDVGSLTSFAFVLNGDWLGEMLKFMRNIDIQVFLRFGSFSPGFLDSSRSRLYQNCITVSRVVACPIAFILLCNLDRQRGVLKLIKTAQLQEFLAIFVLFSQFLEHVKESFTLELPEIVKVLHAVVCPMVFNFISYRDWQGQVLKIMENDHFNFL